VVDLDEMMSSTVMGTDLINVREQQKDAFSGYIPRFDPEIAARGHRIGNDAFGE
jgi:hypothetical protein